MVPDRLLIVAFFSDLPEQDLRHHALIFVL
jgi:hypothetical protein